jgi:hypothetical protein
MLRKLLPTVNVKILSMVYFAHFYTQTSYCFISRGSTSSMRIVFRNSKNSNYDYAETGSKEFL